MTILSRCFTIFLALSVGNLFAQTQPLNSTDHATTPTEIIVTVVNKQGDVLNGLKPDNFRILIDNIPQAVAQVSQEDEPLSVGIVVDTSYETHLTARMKTVTDAIDRFQEVSNSENEYFVIAFDEKPKLLMNWAPNLKESLPKLLRAVPKDRAVVNDALYLAAEKVVRGRNRKHVIIVFSDGLDYGSHYRGLELLELLKQGDTILYAFPIGIEQSVVRVEALEGGLGVAVLKGLTSPTGGGVLLREDGTNWSGRKLEARFETLAGVLRHQYKIRLTPAYKPSLSWHEIKVDLNFPKPVPREAKGSFALTRAGFYVNGQRRN